MRSRLWLETERPKHETEPSDSRRLCEAERASTAQNRTDGQPGSRKPTLSPQDLNPTHTGMRPKTALRCCAHKAHLTDHRSSPAQASRLGGYTAAG